MQKEMNKQTHTDSELDEIAVSILRKNDKGNFTIPTENLYPYQWNWDSAFCTLGIATYDLDRAWTELETLFNAQWENGMVPHIVFHCNDPDYFPGPVDWGTDVDPPSSGISQPPVAAIVISELIGKSDRKEYLARLRKLFPKVLAWHRWFHEFRDPGHFGPVAAVHPWETGRDNSAEWDLPLSFVEKESDLKYERRDTKHVDPDMRPLDSEYDKYMELVRYGRSVEWDPEEFIYRSPFFTSDMGLTMILIRADRELLKLAKMLKEKEAIAEISQWIDRAESGIYRSWNEEVNAFTAFELRYGHDINHITSCTFLAWFAGVANKEQSSALIKHLDRILGKVTYGVPSLDPEHPRFNPIRYWLGPVWLNINYLVAQGLQECGFTEQHDRILENSRELVRKSGFFESFCPKTGRGTGGGNFSWTAAMWLAWASPNSGNGKG